MVASCNNKITLFQPWNSWKPQSASEAWWCVALLEFGICSFLKCFCFIWGALILFKMLLFIFKVFWFYLIASRFHFDLGIIREVEVHQLVIYYSKATCLLSIIIWNGSPFDLIYYHIIIFIIQGKEQTACLQSAMQGTLWFHYCQTNICDEIFLNINI